MNFSKLFFSRLSSGLLVAVSVVGAVSSHAADRPAAAAIAVVRHAAVCPAESARDVAHCHARVVVDERGEVITHETPSGLGPADLRSAYKISSSGNASTVIAIVDAFGYPDAEADLAVYRAQYGLPPCTTANGCFRKVDQRGGTSYPDFNRGWAGETALDLDMASAICPSCSILLVEGDTNGNADLAAAVDTAAALGAHVISNSYGSAESSSSSRYEASYNHPGVAITVSTGDSGYGVQFPASSPHVIAVGGTSLSKASNSRGWTESAWSGAGSGCSTVFAKPSWQTDSGCAKRSVADVSAVADPATGVAVYAPLTRNRATWVVYGGTSAAAPIVGGVYGINGGTVTYGSNPYDTPNSVFDVTTGNNGSCGGSYLCTAGAGYDGPTGLGTPNGPAGF